MIFFFYIFKRKPVHLQVNLAWKRNRVLTEKRINDWLLSIPVRFLCQQYSEYPLAELIFKGIKHSQFRHIIFGRYPRIALWPAGDVEISLSNCWWHCCCRSCPYCWLTSKRRVVFLSPFCIGLLCWACGSPGQKIEKHLAIIWAPICAALPRCLLLASRFIHLLIYHLDSPP